MRRTDLRSARKLVRLNRGGLENLPIFFSMTETPRFFQILADFVSFFRFLSDFFGFFERVEMGRTDLRLGRKLARLNRKGLENSPFFFR